MATLSKFQETAKRILDFPEDMNLHMASYSSEPVSELVDRKHTCGTTFCLAGWLAYKDGYPEEYYINGWFAHTEYSEDLIGNVSIDSWEFLFDFIWPNDKELAIKRAEYVLEHGSHPPKELWSDYE